jgi:hypothetical protein
LNSVSEDELRVIEEIIAERDEYAVYTNLSRRLERAPTSLSETDVSGAVERRGLAWMMALARVELGALAAGFTDHPEPFAMIPPSRYEAAPYLELLLDGARTHTLALANDPVAQYYGSMRGRSVTVQEAVYGPGNAGRSPELAAANEQRAIAYARRVALADEFVKAARKYGAQLSPAQQAELASYREPLRGLEDVLLYKVLGLGADQSSFATTTSSRSESGPTAFSACPRLMEIARADVAAGRHRLEDANRSGVITTQESVKRN